MFILEWVVSNSIEISAAVLGITGVYLTTRQNIWCWPVGLANVILSIFVFLFSRLYADVVLQIFYLIMTIYGWYFWVFGGKNKNQLPIRNMKITELIIITVIGTVSSVFSGFIFWKYTNASYPVWDSFLMVWGILATYAMAKKILQHWILWIIIDINCTALYFLKDLYAFSILYLVFTFLAVYGYIKWKTEWKNQEKNLVV